MILRRQALVLLALLGLLVATYLWLYKIGVVGELKCGTGSCETVQASRYAELLGVPVALYGVVGYAALFALGLAGLDPVRATDPRFTRLLAGLTTAGVLFSWYLTAIEVFVLHAICRWCVTSAVIMTAIWLLSLSLLGRAVR